MTLQEVRLIFFTYILLLLFGLPCFLFLLCVWLYRWVVTLVYTKFKNPSSAGLISGLSSWFLDYSSNIPNDISTSEMSPMNDNAETNIQTLILNLLLEGVLDVEAFRKEFSSKIISALENGKRLYPELTQFVDSWGGYCFWTEDQEFSLQDHVRMCEDRLENFNLETYLRKPFQPKKSPWEVLILHSMNNEKSRLIIKFAHYLADGFSVFNLAQNLVGMERAQPSSKFKPCDKIMTTLAYPLKAPTDFVLSMTRGVRPHPALITKFADGHLRAFSCSQQMPCVRSIKACAQKSQTSFTSVMFTCIAQGLHKFFSSLGQSPSEYNAFFPVPVRNHSSGLANQLYNLAFRLPSGPLEFNINLQRVHQELKNSISSTLYLTLSHLVNLIGSLPTRWQSFPDPKNSPFQLFISTFPGPKEKIVLVGHDVLELTYLAAVPTPAIVLYALTYNDCLQFWAGGMHDVVPKEEIVNLVKCIEKEFKNLDSNSRSVDA